MNPEFQRNVWLELTPMRRWALPLVMALLVVIVRTLSPNASNPEAWNAIATLAQGMVALLTLAGASRAALSVTAEVGAGTWDQQRLAPHQPWELLIGKLLGSTIFYWYGTVLALALYAVAAPQSSHQGNAALNIAIMAVGALCFQAGCLFFSLLTSERQRASRRPSFGFSGQGMFVLLFLFGSVAFPAIGGVISNDARGAMTQVSWWWSMSPPAFVLLSFALFLGWGMIGCNWQLRRELQEPVGPGPWLGFLAFLVLYLFPLVEVGMEGKFGGPAVAACGTLAAVCGLWVQPLAIGDRFDAVRLRRMVAAKGRGDWAAVWRQLPLWGFALVGYFAGVIGLGVLQAGGLLQGPDGSIFLIGMAAGLLMLRDIGWIVGLKLGKSSGRSPVLAIVFYLVLLYWLLPMPLGLMGEGMAWATNLVLPVMAVIGRHGEVHTAAALAWGLPGVALAWLFAVPRILRAIADRPREAGV